MPTRNLEKIEHVSKLPLFNGHISIAFTFFFADLLDSMCVSICYCNGYDAVLISTFCSSMSLIVHQTIQSCHTKDAVL